MPKQKTKKSIAKRFRITKSGKVLRRQSFKRHLNVKKSSKRKRRLSRVVITKKVHADKIKKALGVRKGKPKRKQKTE
jgi:large subunit ribosomal protein L35